MGEQPRRIDGELAAVVPHQMQSSKLIRRKQSEEPLSSLTNEYRQKIGMRSLCLRISNS